jgi:hypothetical protein
MTPSPENPSTDTPPLEDRIGNLIDRMGDCIIKHVEYQVKRDTFFMLADKTKIGLLFSVMVSSWLTVALLMFIAAMIFLGEWLGPVHHEPEVRQVAPPPAERPYEIHQSLEARTVA